jgi:hypothetical protein
MAATTIEPGPDAGERPAGKGKAEPAMAAAPTVQPPVGPRVYWRAVVRTGGQIAAASRERDRVEWHLTGCESPRAEGAHCTEGQHLIETVGHPDGHCIIGGVCGLCGAPQRETD